MVGMAGIAAFQNAKTPKIKLDFAMFSSQPENVKRKKRKDIKS